MKKAFIFTAVVLTLAASCAPKRTKPTVFVPCVTVQPDRTDKTDCMCRFQDRVHVTDTAFYSEPMYQIGRMHGRTFWQPYMYGI
jgi:hypothetical protein